MTIRLEVEGVRCFGKKQSAEIRPLTILVGENSSGKSTFLALCEIASALAKGELAIRFNEPPFQLGAFEQIASYRGPIDPPRPFSIAIAINQKPDDPVALRATFEPEQGQPILRSTRLSVGSCVRTLDHIESSVKRGPLQWQLPQEDPRRETLLSGLERLGNAFQSNPRCFAPIRTSPARTYDPIRSQPTPEGAHIPTLLARLSRNRGGANFAAVGRGLKQFGSRSGLFEQIEIIQKGKKDSDPFQIGVKSGGPTFNLVDVGYGVSQILPILVETLRDREENSLFLMQQPEVHLHPRAQAELGSFFAREASEQRRFVIETHSDYLVDRIRMDVRRHRIKPDAVSLLYFERKRRQATIHTLTLDGDGNIVNPPDGYRQFFLDEENRLLES